MNINLIFTLQIIFLVAIAFMAITAWDEFLDRTVIKYFNLNRESVRTWFIIAVSSTSLFILLLYIFGVEAHDILGVSETADIILSGKKS